MNIEIYPLEKIVVDGVSVYLGMDQPAVKLRLAKVNLQESAITTMTMKWRLITAKTRRLNSSSFWEESTVLCIL